jgi:hypothetical protein
MNFFLERDKRANPGKKIKSSTMWKHPLLENSAIKSTLIAGALIVALFACSKSGGDASTNSIDCSGITKSFSSDANPVIQSNCATNSGCHGSGSRNGPGELLNYSQIFAARSSIRSAVVSGLMPQNGTLSTSQKQAIVCWIDSGAPNN